MPAGGARRERRAADGDGVVNRRRARPLPLRRRLLDLVRLHQRARHRDHPHAAAAAAVDHAPFEANSSTQHVVEAVVVVFGGDGAVGRIEERHAVGGRRRKKVAAADRATQAIAESCDPKGGRRPPLTACAVLASMAGPFSACRRRLRTLREELAEDRRERAKSERWRPTRAARRDRGEGSAPAPAATGGAEELRPRCRRPPSLLNTDMKEWQLVDEGVELLKTTDEPVTAAAVAGCTHRKILLSQPRGGHDRRKVDDRAARRLDVRVVHARHRHLPARRGARGAGKGRPLRAARHRGARVDGPGRELRRAGVQPRAAALVVLRHQQYG